MTERRDDTITALYQQEDTIWLTTKYRPMYETMPSRSTTTVRIWTRSNFC